jgi:D-tagatose-1,6-bisphosphate aldolase subunit GatZ/KbaZ
MHPLKQMIADRRSGVSRGIYSSCSANEVVIEAVMRRAQRGDDHVLIEATANQVNQEGGYTGMRPGDFRDFVYRIADGVGFPAEKIILGGDHLGPLAWSHLPADRAMEHSSELVRQFVGAGFTKIHLDTSMPLGDDFNSELDLRVVAQRGAQLARVAEQAFAEFKRQEPNALHPVYVVGSEVPIPGGSQGEEDGVLVTSAAAFRETLDVFTREFAKLGLDAAWDQVIAFVVQPGVEFGDQSIHLYDRSAAHELVSTLKEHPNLVFEGHSTDYQTAQGLREMVEDGIAILKVGPALTFALREALVALDAIEVELLAGTSAVPSQFSHVLEKQMVAQPQYWRNHYRGDERAKRLARKYSYSDRCRYYLPMPEMAAVISRLLENLRSYQIPMTLLSQYLPLQYRKVLEGRLDNDARELIIDRVTDCIEDYLFATRG